MYMLKATKQWLKEIKELYKQSYVHGGMLWGGRREEGSGWGTHVYLWQIHFDKWQNQYNVVKLKNKIKKKEDNIVKMSVLPKVIYRLSIISIKIPTAFLIEMERPSLKSYGFLKSLK